MHIKLFESELHIMKILWEHGDLEAKQIAILTSDKLGWKKTTTYTVLGKCIDKGAIQRSYPNYICHALYSKEDIQLQEANNIVQNLFDGSTELLFTSLLSHKQMSSEELQKLKDIVNQWKPNNHD